MKIAVEVPQKKTLLQIEEEIDELLTAYADTKEGIENEDELARFEQAMCDMLDRIEDEEALKIDGYGMLLSKLEAESDRLGTIHRGIAARKKTTDNRIARLKAHVLYAMQLHGKKKIEGTVFTARINSSVAVEVTIDPKNLSPKYRRIKYEPDKVAISDALKAGKKVKGAKLTPTESVSIKA